MSAKPQHVARCAARVTRGCVCTGLPATPCILLVTFGSLFAAICVATTWMFFIWLCTRPVAAVIFLVISVSGQLLIPSGNPILLLLWMLVTFGGGWAYFFWLPDVYRDKPQDKPAWVQDVGTFRLSYEPGEVMDVIGAKVKLEAQKFKVCMCLCVCVCICLSVYLYVERDRERVSERERFMDMIGAKVKWEAQKFKVCIYLSICLSACLPVCVSVYPYVTREREGGRERERSDRKRERERGERGKRGKRKRDGACHLQAAPHLCLLLNVCSYCRMCSLTVECVLL